MARLAMGLPRGLGARPASENQLSSGCGGPPGRPVQALRQPPGSLVLRDLTNATNALNAAAGKLGADLPKAAMAGTAANVANVANPANVAHAAGAPQPRPPPTKAVEAQPRATSSSSHPQAVGSYKLGALTTREYPAAAVQARPLTAREHSAVGRRPALVVYQDDVDDDMQGATDPQSVSEYAHDIYANLGRDEANFMPRPDYMDAQADINSKMRAILIDWLIEVHLKYKLKTETLFLAVNLLDRFLERRQMSRKRLQLCGVTALLIASKFEEIFPPEIRDFVYITDNAYTREDILRMEIVMLTTLKFVVCCPTAAHFLERFRRLNQCSEAHFHLMQYMLELALPDIQMIRYPPSHIAAAAALLSNTLLKQQPAWTAAMVKHTRHSEPMVRGCARDLQQLLKTAEQNQLQAVRRKFSQPKFSSVALLNF